MTKSYPVGYRVEYPERLSRVQLAVRIVAFVALGFLGVSFGALFAFAYLALPVLAAARLATGRDGPAYVTSDGPRIFAALGWIAALSAWASLTTDRLPERSPSETVKFTLEATGHPTSKSAVWRVITGLPSALVLALLGWLGVFVWLWAALSILAIQRVDRLAFHYLVGLQRWSLRLLAYQASLIDEYPPFTFADTSETPWSGRVPTEGTP